MVTLENNACMHICVKYQLEPHILDWIIVPLCKWPFEILQKEKEICEIGIKFWNKIIHGDDSESKAKNTAPTGLEPYKSPAWRSNRDRLG